MARRTKAEIDHIKLCIYQLCREMQPMTVRQLFYQLTTLCVINKTEAEYKQTVCRLTANMRFAGELPWHWLADNTRWIRKPMTYGGLDDCLGRHKGPTDALCGIQTPTINTLRFGLQNTPLQAFSQQSPRNTTCR